MLPHGSIPIKVRYSPHIRRQVLTIESNDLEAPIYIKRLRKLIRLCILSFDCLKISKSFCNYQIGLYIMGIKTRLFLLHGDRYVTMDKPV